MDKYRIILVPADNDELYHEFEASCKDVDAARQQATVYLVMQQGRYKEARVLSQWKSQISWRQAIAPIVYNNNL